MFPEPRKGASSLGRILERRYVDVLAYFDRPHTLTDPLSSPTEAISVSPLARLMETLIVPRGRLAEAFIAAYFLRQVSPSSSTSIQLTKAEPRSIG